jgi:hypothetical protein
MVSFLDTQTECDCITAPSAPRFMVASLLAVLMWVEWHGHSKSYRKKSSMCTESPSIVLYRNDYGNNMRWCVLVVRDRSIECLGLHTRKSSTVVESCSPYVYAQLNTSIMQPLCSGGRGCNKIEQNQKGGLDEFSDDSCYQLGLNLQSSSLVRCTIVDILVSITTDKVFDWNIHGDHLRVVVRVLQVAAEFWRRAEIMLKPE